jgi:hypothetical protein
VTTNNYITLTELHATKIAVTTAHIKSSVFTSCCLAAASNDGRSPSSGFPNCPRPQLPTSHFSQLNISTDSITTELLVIVIQPRQGPQRKRLFHYCVFSHYQGNNVSTELFSSHGCSTVTCLHSCYLAMGLHVTILMSFEGIVGEDVELIHLAQDRVH